MQEYNPDINLTDIQTKLRSPTAGKGNLIPHTRSTKKAQAVSSLALDHPGYGSSVLPRIDESVIGKKRQNAIATVESGLMGSQSAVELTEGL